jgi:aryl-alcohol dehydrogenase-like predicted oxidoreductase
MEYRQLGRSELRVSAVAMGCWAIVGDQTWGPQDEADALSAIRAARDAGINFFDTAEMYGDGYSEELLGRALAGRRRDAVIASKAGSHHLAPADLKVTCETALRRLQTDYLDLYQIHWPSRTVPLAETLGALKELQTSGKVRVIGVSNFGPGDLGDLLKLGRAESNQVPYSLLWRAIEFEILPLCIRNEIGVLCYSPLAQGLLTGKFKSADEVPEGRARTKHFSSKRGQTRHRQPGQEEATFRAIAEIAALAKGLGCPMGQLALAWLIHQRGVASVLAGARNAGQARENARAGELRLTADVLKRLDAATKALKDAFGPEPDMWAAETRYR